MKRHEQIITKHKGEEVLGGATCPICFTRNVLMASGKMIVIDPATRCEHANMVVDAGFPEVAIHFEWHDIKCPSCGEWVHPNDMSEYNGKPCCDGCACNADMFDNFDDPCGKDWR